MKQCILIIVACVFISTLHAQVDTLSAKKDTLLVKNDSLLTKEDSSIIVPYKRKSYFVASVNYLSNSLFNGRKDSVATPYLTPMVGYYDKSGFFVNASLSYLARTGSERIDLVNLGAGYSFVAGNFDGSISANKSFYNSNSTNPRSEIKGSVFVSAAYDFNFIEAQVEGGINFADKPDYIMQLELEHTFYAASDNLQITPSILANASTQNYYGSYYANRKYGSKKKRQAGITYQVFADVTDASRFSILDYEYNLSIDYKIKKFTLNFTPAYVMPQHPATVTVNLVPSSGPIPATKVFTEKLSNTFYFTLGLTYKLKK